MPVTASLLAPPHILFLLIYSANNRECQIRHTYDANQYMGVLNGGKHIGVTSTHHSIYLLHGYAALAPRATIASNLLLPDRSILS